MKNKLGLLIALAVLVAAVLGCSYSFGTSESSDKSSEKTPGSTNSQSSSDKATNPADANSTARTGVAACDEFVDLVQKEMTPPDDNFVSRGIREVAINTIKDQIKKNIEENQGDKEKISVACKTMKEEFIKEQQKKNTEQ